MSTAKTGWRTDAPGYPDVRVGRDEHRVLWLDDRGTFYQKSPGGRWIKVDALPSLPEWRTP